MALVPAAVFLVEGYSPAPDANSLLSLAERLEREAGRTSAEARVRHVQSSVIPDDDMCLCLIAGPTPAAVREVAERAGLRVIRVTEALHVPTGETDQ